MDEIELFGTPLSPFVEKVRRALGRKKLDYVLVQPGGRRDFRRWNPQTGKMPVLRIGGETIYDSTFICRRLDERYPEPPLVSRDPRTRAAQLLLEDWADESLYWMGNAIRFTPKNTPAAVEEMAGTVPGWIRPLVRLAIRRQLGKGPVAQGLGRLPPEVLAREFALRLDDLVTLLADRRFFYAEEPSVADFAIYAMLDAGGRPASPEMGAAVRRRPSLLAWMRRVREATGG